MAITHSHPIHPSVGDKDKYPGGQRHVDSFGVYFGHDVHVKAAKDAYKDGAQLATALEHTHDVVDEAEHPITGQVVWKASDKRKRNDAQLDPTSIDGTTKVDTTNQTPV